jgi:uncharacterized coiled-coil protein SlyX
MSEPITGLELSAILEPYEQKINGLESYIGEVEKRVTELNELLDDVRRDVEALKADMRSIVRTLRGTGHQV